MIPVKEQLLTAIESAPEPVLEQVLNYLEYLTHKAKSYWLQTSVFPIRP